MHLPKTTTHLPSAVTQVHKVDNRNASASKKIHYTSLKVSSKNAMLASATGHKYANSTSIFKDTIINNLKRQLLKWKFFSECVTGLVVRAIGAAVLEWRLHRWSPRGE